MLKSGCIFDMKAVENFYAKCGKSAEICNDTMFFEMTEDGEFFGMIRLKACGDVCKMDDIVAIRSDLQLEEFLLKSCVNFALTFNCKKIETTKKYMQFLIPMHFCLEGEILSGELEKIDFPHTCCGGNAEK